MYNLVMSWLSRDKPKKLKVPNPASKGYPKGAIGEAAEELAVKARKRAQTALQALDQIETATLADHNAVVKAATAVADLGFEASAVAQELSRVSNGEARLMFGGGTDRENRNRLASWRDRNLPASNHDHFDELVTRYLELVAATHSAYHGVKVLGKDIDEALRKSKIIAAAASLNPDLGREVDPEFALEHVSEARDSAKAISSGLDEAYAVAQRQLAKPKLPALESSAPAVAAEETPSLSL
jgi:hypothetical protein